MGNFDFSVVTEVKRDLSRAANSQNSDSVFRLVLPTGIGKIG